MARWERQGKEGAEIYGDGSKEGEDKGQGQG